jgi:hypothetical protein
VAFEVLSGVVSGALPGLGLVDELASGVAATLEVVGRVTSGALATPELAGDLEPGSAVVADLGAAALIWEAAASLAGVDGFAAAATSLPSCPLLVAGLTGPAGAC